jgi:serine/threonine protein kinase
LEGEAFPPPKNGSSALQQIVMKACAYEPKDRYSNAEQLAQALREVL